jgi:hypothetical protein
MTEWEAQQALLEAHTAATGEPLDPEVIDIVVALNLLGFPTVGSCGGHADEPDALPFIYIRYRPEHRFDEAAWARIWNSPERATPAERSHLAGIAWYVCRPLAHELRDWYDAFCRAAGVSGLFRVSASWRGVWFEPRSEASLELLQAELEAFGGFLKRELVS